MAKAKTPFFGFASQGSVGESITSQKRGRDTVIRQLPVPSDPYSLPQAYQRWLYEDYCHLWTLQSASVKSAYRSQGVPHHLTGFQYWMKYHLSHMPDIAGYWKLDTVSAGITPDTSLNLISGTVQGAPIASGAIGYSLYFDGVNNRVTFDISSALDFGIGAFSISLLTKFEPSLVSRAIITKQSAWNHGFQLGREINGKLYFIYGDGINATLLNSTTASDDNSFHQAIITRDDSGNAYLYVDGLLEDSDIGAWNITVPNAMNLAQIGGAAGGWGEGCMDHVLVYNRYLHPSEPPRMSQRRYPL